MWNPGIHLRIHLLFTWITQELQIAEEKVFYLKTYKWTKARKTTAHFENINPLPLPHKVLELFPEETLDQLSQYHSLKIIICNFVKWNWKSKTLYETHKYILQDNTENVIGVQIVLIHFLGISNYCYTRWYICHFLGHFMKLRKPTSKCTEYMK